MRDGGHLIRRLRGRSRDGGIVLFDGRQGVTKQSPTHPAKNANRGAVRLDLPTFFGFRPPQPENKRMSSKFSPNRFSFGGGTGESFLFYKRKGSPASICLTSGSSSPLPRVPRGSCRRAEGGRWRSRRCRGRRRRGAGCRRRGGLRGLRERWDSARACHQENPR